MRAWALAVGLLSVALVARPARGPACTEPGFHGEGVLEEAGSIEESTDACWWLSSGGRLYFEPGRARTIQGDLPADAEWAQRYAQSNPADTDGGSHPQNLLRLVARGRWRDFRQEVRVRIHHVNLSQSSERGEWSGVLLFLRYQDSDNLYYAGLRMDGTAVIKKKAAGVYTTLAQEPVFGEPQAWDRERNPVLLPLERWIALAALIRTQKDGSTRIALYTRDESREPDWKLAAEVTDDGQQGPPLRAAGHGGIRTDFMDVELADYRVGAPVLH